jgi:hypothetical protein
VHTRDEVVHVRQRRGIGLDHHLEAGIEDVELEVGDHDRDLDEFVDLEVEPGHLAIDPDEAVVLRGIHHAFILMRACDLGADASR